jgi:putative acetyltransferase
MHEERDQGEPTMTMTMTMPQAIIDVRSPLALVDDIAPEGELRKTRALVVRRERPTDHDAVAEVHAVAFADPDREGPPGEVALVEALRQSNAYVFGLSLVAEVDDEMAGHILCTRATVNDRYPALAMAPLGVRREHRGQGVGTALVNAVLGAADALGHTMVGVLGSPEYYGRFGFQPSRVHGIEAPEAWWGDSFQVRSLTTASDQMQGRFQYAAPFNR